VELDDGTKWRVFPGDLDVTLNWQPDAELKLVLIVDEVSSHALISENDNSRVRIIPASENWPVQEVRTILRTVELWAERSTSQRAKCVRCNLL
jgi:hypothetical protein